MNYRNTAIGMVFFAQIISACATAGEQRTVQACVAERNVASSGQNGAETVLKECGSEVRNTHRDRIMERANMMKR